MAASLNNFNDGRQVSEIEAVMWNRTSTSVYMIKQNALSNQLFSAESRITYYNDRFFTIITFAIITRVKGISG